MWKLYLEVKITALNRKKYIALISINELQVGNIVI